MTNKNVMFDGEMFDARYYYNEDDGTDCVDVYYINEDNEESYVGCIENISIPDEDDEEQIESFENEVVKWLYTQDINYSN